MDASIQIFEKQRGRLFRPASFYLIDGRVIHGVIVSYSLGEPGTKETFITMWHIVSPEMAMNGGRDFLGFMDGEIVQHEELDKVVFDDGTTITCRK